MIRPATLSDLDSLALLERESFPEDAFSRSRLKHLVSRAKSVAIVCDEDGIRGYVLLLFRDDTDAARIYSICVGRKYRNKGVGKALVCSAERVARERGCRRMTLEVRENSDAAVRFYNGLGFSFIGNLRDYYHPGAHGLRMMKRI
ncbi:MAG: N-acetyltransferase [Methanomassiliicoccales archaeon]|jgi:ribosomal protein S18 acetylase RimI-like enzyme